MKEIVILIRRAGQWVRFGSASSLEEADRVWKSRISGRGITAWTEFTTPEDADKMIQDPSYIPSPLTPNNQER